MAGGMGATKNKYVEDWGTMRENLEKTFRFNRKTLSLGILFGVVVPVLIYRGSVSEFVSFETSILLTVITQAFEIF